MEIEIIKSCVRDLKRIRTHFDQVLDQRTRQEFDAVIDRLESCLTGEVDSIQLQSTLTDGLRLLATLVEAATNVSELLERYLR